MPSREIPSLVLDNAIQLVDGRIEGISLHLSPDVQREVNLGREFSSEVGKSFKMEQKHLRAALDQITLFRLVDLLAAVLAVVLIPLNQELPFKEFLEAAEDVNIIFFADVLKKC